MPGMPKSESGCGPLGANEPIYPFAREIRNPQIECLRVYRCEPGAWCLVLGVWCLVLGAWCLVLQAQSPSDHQ